MQHLFDLDPQDERRLDALVDAVIRLQARGFNIVNVKVPRSLMLRMAACDPWFGKLTTFRGYPIKVVED